MLEHVAHLVGDRVLVDRHRDGTQALHSGKGGIKPGSIVADDGDRVAALKTELAQTDAEGLHLLTEARPAPGLPDAEILVPDCRAMSVLRRVSQQKLGYRV